MLSIAETRSGESAFTLIELLIALVLAGVVFGVGGLLVTSIFLGSSQSRAERRSGQQASTVLERFERDVRYAQSPDVLDHPRSGDDLRGLLLWGKSRTPAGQLVELVPDQCSSSVAVAQSDFCRFEDITVATSTDLWVRSDVRNATAADDGVECVRWEVRDRALWRTVHRAGPEPDCRRIGGSVRAGQQVESERMLGAPITQDTGNTERRAASLGYLIVWNPIAAAAPVGSIVDPTTCQTRQTNYTAGPSGRERSFVTTITLDLAATTTASQGTAARSRYAVSASLQGRANDDYVRAAGCAY
ncbi:MAG: hypothetical protein JWM25_1105 [Thermoleophilia bacterium]|nr:hypothetical protein [Thermoleophilia bacterium]MCZ4496522.1 hypothetical protein [Thermoleophilia bacterium]